MIKKRILSGMRPTGSLHLGHLVGALNNWIKLQDEYDCFFMVADWHALMSEYANPGTLKENILDNVIDWLACGVDPEKCTIFIQSQIPEHLELYFILSLITPLGLLERCPTYKEQLREITNRDLSTYAFLGYPVLQAADILLYKADTVPVGEDQLPHLELARQIVRKFNHLYKTDCLIEPKALLTKTSRLLGVDGRKMSKSYNNCIYLSEGSKREDTHWKDDVYKKVQSMFTDPKRIRSSDPGHPDKCNVCNYYEVFFPEMTKEVKERCVKAQIGCTQCKKELAEKLIDLLTPIRERRRELWKNKDNVKEILEKGKSKAEKQAKETIAQVRELLKI